MLLAQPGKSSPRQPDFQSVHWPFVLARWTLRRKGLYEDWYFFPSFNFRQWNPVQHLESVANTLNAGPHQAALHDAVTLVTGVTLFLVSFLYLSYMGRK